MELNNGEKSKRGNNLQNSLEDTLIQLKSKNYIKDYQKEYRIGQQGYSNTTQFYAPFHISFHNNEEWVLFATTSLRTDRVKGQQWDTYNIKNINKNIKQALLIYPDGINEKEEKEFKKQQSKYENKTEVSYIDGILSHEQFYSLIENIALSTLTVGKQKDIQGKDFEIRVADILSDKNNLIRWNKDSGVIDGSHYPIFETILNSFKLIKGSINKIHATASKEKIGILPSKGNPKTDVLVTITLISGENITKTISCKRTNAKSVSVHEYSAESFSDVLDSSNSKLKDLLILFQNTPSLRDFGEENTRLLTEELKPYSKKLSEWVLGGVHGIGNKDIQWATHILTYNNNDNSVACKTINEYIDKLTEQGIKGHFGTFFSWTYPSKKRGKKIQLKCKII